MVENPASVFQKARPHANDKMYQRHDVNVGGISIVWGRKAILTARALGSCVGVGILSPVHKLAALAHIQLPNNLPDLQTQSPPMRRDREFAVAAAALDKIDQHFSQKKIDWNQCFNVVVGGAKKTAIGPKSTLGNANLIAVRDWFEARQLKIHRELTGGSNW